MPMKRSVVSILVLDACAHPAAAPPTSPVVAVGPQYDTTHVYVAPEAFSTPEQVRAIAALR